jgi:uncharacterized glyoxalase superfamily protein PhnB
MSTTIFYRDPGKAIDWLCRAFGFEVRIKVEGAGGRIEHSELELGGGLVMVAGAGSDYERPQAAPWRARYASPEMLDGKMTQHLCVHIDDVDAHCARARAAGATIFYEPKNTDYGEDYWEDRCYGAFDPEGHGWYFMQRIRSAKS